MYNEIEVSWQDRVFNSKGLKLNSLNKILDTIQTSDDIRRKVIELRKIKDEKQQKKYKEENFPYFNLGTFKDGHRKNANLISSSHFIFDYDNLDEKLDVMRTQLKKDNRVFAFFVSPRGNGLKVIYRLDKAITDPNTFSKLYKHYAKEFKLDLGADPDKTSDASRPCFFSYDAFTYVNNDSIPLRTEIIFDDVECAKVASTEKRAELISNLSGTNSGNRTPTATQLLGNFIVKGVDRMISHEILQMWNKQNMPPLPVEKITYIVNDMYDRYEEKEKYLSVKFVERNNSYVKTIKQGKDFVQTMVTSFKIIPKELLVLDNSDCLKCDIISSQDNHYEDVLIENTDWHSKQKFLKALGHQDCVFLGSDNDLQALCQYTQLNIPLRKKGTKVIGLHNDVWVIEDINITKAGKTEELQIVPYDKGSDAFYHRISYRFLDDNSKQDMRRILYENILNINEKRIILPYIGWLFATPVKCQLEKITGAFPLLFNHGGAGSGKTSTAKVFARLGGYKDPAPMSVTMKTFPLLKMLSSTNSIPQWYDEFKVSDMKETDVDNILRFMRKVYSGEQESKGRADQTIENYKLSAPMVVMGEWNINQPAIMERVVLVRCTDVVKKNLDMQKAFQNIEALELEAFMPEYIQYCLNTDVKELFTVAKEFIIDHFGQIKVAPRIINNLSVMLVGLELFRGYAGYAHLPVPDIDYERLIEDQLKEITGSQRGMVRSAVDQLIEELSIMAEKSEITPLEDYKFADVDNNKNVLAIRFNKIFPDFKVYAKKTNYEGDLLDKSSYLKLFDECDYIINKNWNVKFGLVTNRCICIDIEKAKNAGLNLDGFRL
ncbi:MAG: BT4734/BF3469 family protein [Ignavibacteriaceae bacterium]|nr:BT4734/BF3469 family protein [Ignavibacteriaceae bacterium]